MFPKHTPDGLRVMYYGFNNQNSHLFQPVEIYRRMRILLDIMLRKGIDFTGVYVIIDTRYCTLSHVSRLDLLQLKNLIKLAQVCNFEVNIVQLILVHIHFFNIM